MKDTTTPDSVINKPCIALMGEFSAGKSTLSNLMLGAKPLPERVTATQLPPVWLTHGTGDAFREDLEGNQHPVSLDSLEDVPLSETLYIKIFMETDILTVCDLIDFPGISDPNMPPEVWQRMVTHADSVLWCTHATQAWRQSEAAVWETMPPSLYNKSLLLVTRIDKILTERDRTKVLRRLTAETEGLFSGLFPISLVAAVAAGDDVEKWVESGAEAFTDRLIDLVQELVVEKENSATNADEFKYGEQYVVGENAAQSPIERMNDVPVINEEPEGNELLTDQDCHDEDDSSFEEVTEETTELGLEDDAVASVMSKLSVDDTDQRADVAHDEGGYESEPFAKAEPLTLTNRIDRDAPPAQTGKHDLLPPLSPIEDAASTAIEETAPKGTVIPRRVRRLSSDGSPRSDRPARPTAAVDDMANTARPKAALSPLNSLSNLRGVFAADSVQPGQEDT